MSAVNVLHIGKTGGSALRLILRRKLREAGSGRRDVNIWGHAVKMRQVLRQAGRENPNVVFFVRDPVARFRSAFNSRLREGKPRYDFPWSAAEAQAFALFKTPDQLGMALGAADRATRRAAAKAMHGIRHVGDPVTSWLVSPGFLNKHASSIFYIGLQESFDADARSLLARLGLDDTLPDLNERQRHATPAGFSQELSPDAVRNLRRWYADDCRIYDWCVSRRVGINAGDGVSAEA